MRDDEYAQILRERLDALTRQYERQAKPLRRKIAELENPGRAERPPWVPACECDRFALKA